MIDYFEKPITKKYDEIQPGDVFRTEYGDYDNFCNFVFESHNVHDKGIIEIIYHRPGETKSDKCYSFSYPDTLTYDVIGTEKTDNEVKKYDHM